MNQVEKIKLKRLYKISQELQTKKPWEFFEDIGILAITLSNRKTPFYCVFLLETIIVLPNKAALKGLFYLSDQHEMPEIQRLRYQQHLALYFDKADELNSETFEILMELDVEPIDNKYPLFESVMPGLLPDELVKQEIQSMVDILKQVNESMDEMKEIIALNHDIENQIVHRYFDFDQKKWTFNLLDMVDQDISVNPIPIKKEFLSKCQKQSTLQQEWEVDVAYTPVMIDPKKGHRQAVIRVLAIANHQKEEVYFQKLVTLKDDSNRMMVDQVIDRILNSGKPLKLIVRDEIVKSLFSQLSEKLLIPIEVNQKLETIDRFVNAFTYQSLN